MSEIEQDSRIQSTELAHYIGYAEHPYRELAAVALKHRLQDSYEDHITKANMEGQAAGQAYIDSLQVSLDYFGDTSGSHMGKAGANRESLKSLEIQDHVTFTKTDVITFARDTNYANVTKSQFESGPGSQDAINASLAGLAWKSLIKFSKDSALSEHSYELRGIKTIPVITNMDMDKQYNYRALNNFATFTLDSVEDFISEVEEVRLNNEWVSLSGMLGRGFGEKRLDLLKKFVEFKKQQLSQTENQNI